MPEVSEARPRTAERTPPNHPVRAKIQAYVTKHPGVHMGDLVRDLHLGWGNAHHHLDHMERKAQIMREPEGNRVRLFVPGQVPAPMRHAYAVLKNECLRDTFRTVVDHPGIIQRDVAAALGVTPTAARKHLRRLSEEGLIRAERAGNRVRYRAAADAIGLELRLWLRYGRLGETSPKRAEHPNDPQSDTAATADSPPEPARFDTSHDLGRGQPAPEPAEPEQPPAEARSETRAYAYERPSYVPGRQDAPYAHAPRPHAERPAGAQPASHASPAHDDAPREHDGSTDAQRRRRHADEADQD